MEGRRVAGIVAEHTNLSRSFGARDYRRKRTPRPPVTGDGVHTAAPLAMGAQTFRPIGAKKIPRRGYGATVPDWAPPTGDYFKGRPCLNSAARGLNGSPFARSIRSSSASIALSTIAATGLRDQ